MSTFRPLALERLAAPTVALVGWFSWAIAPSIPASPPRLGATAGAQAEDAQPLRGSEEPRPADAEALFARFARMQGLEVSFAEKKHLALLAIPLESRGKLYFLRPGHLTRVVESPSPSRLTIGPERLRMFEDGREEVLDLRRNEELGMFVTSLVRIFSGDEESLERFYHIAFEHEGEQGRDWRLALEPRAEPLNRMLARLTLEGRGAAVLSIELLEPNGDRTTTTILAANPERRFTDEERGELFGLPPLDPGAGSTQRPGDPRR